MMKSFYLLLISLSIYSCSNSNFEYKELKDCNFEMVKLKEKTKFRVISYSGGKYCDNDTNYYYQFIAINQETLDTVRILSLCQQYDFKKDKKIGSFSSKGDISGLINEVLNEYGSDIDSADKMVVFNKKLSHFESKNYKTIIGSLSF